MKYYIIAGEASGDLHGAALIHSLRNQDPKAECRGWGGDLMHQAGMHLTKHIRDLAFMGLGQVLKNLPTIANNFKICHKDILHFQPNSLILIDYSGFNLRIAKWAKNKGIHVIYFISPQIWATREKRVHKIKAYVDKMYVILPFEKAFYQKHHYSVEYVGHPLLDIIKNKVKEPTFRQKHQLDERPIIALLPGSRKQEIRSMLNLMIEIADCFSAYQFVVAAAPSIAQSFYINLMNEATNVKIISNQTYDILQHSHAALVTSGTATLEAALFKVPQIVCYKTSALMYQLVKRIIKVPYISIVNLIMGEKVVVELIQKECNIHTLKLQLEQLLAGEVRQKMLEKYALLEEKLGTKGATNRAAVSMVLSLKNYLNNQKQS